MRGIQLERACCTYTWQMARFALAYILKKHIIFALFLRRLPYVCLTCGILLLFSGQLSCRVDLVHTEDDQGPPLDRLAERRMVFDPALGGSDARCPCDTVGR